MDEKGSELRDLGYIERAPPTCPHASEAVITAKKDFFLRRKNAFFAVITASDACGQVGVACVRCIPSL
eukprot:801048-Prorocentrum_minimum.AAC.1